MTLKIQGNQTMGRIVGFDSFNAANQYAESRHSAAMLLSAARGVMHPEACRYDEKGYCKPHGDVKPCRQETLKQAIAHAEAWQEVSNEQNG